MTLPRPGPFWAVAALGGPQAVLGASILFESQSTWWYYGASYLVWLAWVNWHEDRRTVRVIGLGYLIPLALFAGAYAWGAMDRRPETAQAVELMRPAPPPPRTPGTDVPSPKLAPAGGDRALTRGSWALASTFLYFAACAVWGLMTSTPVPVWAVAVVTAVFAYRPKEDRN